VNKKLLIHRTILLHKFIIQRNSFYFSSYLFFLSTHTMSSSNTSFSEAIADLNRNMSLVVQIWTFVIFAFGIFGHSLNIYVLTRPKFRFNPCSRYLLASSISGYAVVCIIIPIRLLQISYNIDVFVYSVPMCQILTYAFYWLK